VKGACGRPSCAENPAAPIRSGPDAAHPAAGEASCERRPATNPIILATDGSASAADATSEAAKAARDAAAAAGLDAESFVLEGEPVE
jgi:hypothetical protein